MTFQFTKFEGKWKNKYVNKSKSNENILRIYFFNSQVASGDRWIVHF